MGPSDSYPWYFDIQGNLYRARGDKSDDGSFKLEAMNEPEYRQDYYLVDWTGTREFVVSGGSDYSGMMKSQLPMRDYPRRATATVMAWGASISGYVNLTLIMHDGAKYHSRFTSDDSTVSATLSCEIPAGQSPSIVAGLTGDGKVRLSADRNQNRLMVSADPISIAR